MMQRLRSPGSGTCCLVIGTALLPVVWWQLPPLQSSQVALPTTGAAPGQVVERYRAALNAHDCDTARALRTNPDSATAWCTRFAKLTTITIYSATAEDPAWSGHQAGDKIVRVPATFTLTSRALRDDVSLPDGPTTWGYLLEHRNGTWRIFDQGAA